MVTTDRAELAELARSLRDHGASRSDLDRHASRGAFLLAEYDHLGFNYRMTDIQGALGCAQMDRARLDPRASARGWPRSTTSALAGLDWLAHAGRARAATSTGGSPTCACSRRRSRRSRTCERLHDRRNALMAQLERAGIATRQGTHAPRATGYYGSKYGLRARGLPAGASSPTADLALPLYPQMTDAEHELVVAELRRPPSRRSDRVRDRRRADRAGAPVPERAAAHERRDRPPRPRRRGPVRRRARRARPTAASRSSTSRRRAHMPMATERRPLRRSPTTARSTTSASCARELEAAGHRFRSHTDTEVVLQRLRGVGPACVERFNGMFAFAIWDRERARRSSSRATATASSRSTTRDARRRVPVRLRDQGAPRAPALHARAEPARTCSSTSPSRTSSPTARCSTACSCCRAGHHADGRRGRRPRAAAAVLGLRLPRAETDGAPRRGVRGGARPPVPAGGRAPARLRRAGRRAPQRRHGLRAASPRSPPRRCRT